MPHLSKCRNGHSWNDPGEPNAPPGAGRACPVCGSTEVVTVWQSSGDVADTLEEGTLLRQFVPGNGPTGLGGPHLPPGQFAAERTAEGVAQTLEQPDGPPPSEPGPEPAETLEGPGLPHEGNGSGAGTGQDAAGPEGPSGSAEVVAVGPMPRRGPSAIAKQTRREALGGQTDVTLEKPTEPAPAAPVRQTRPEVAGYEILGTLGRGGMGVVYRARQVGLNRVVALKMILSGAHAGPRELARFRIEAQAVAQLAHPNIVQVYDVGERDGRPFFSLEYCPGGSLQQKLKGTPLPPREAARMLEALARAMHYAHQHGIVHRDLKPANILLAADGTPKITDFGLAKRLEQDDGGHTASEAVLGTPAYMAPEQAAGKTREVGPAADIYSLGSIFYDVLTGRPPFQGTTVMDTLQQVQSAEPVPPSRLQPGVPADLQTVCLRCLEKEPRKRYPSAGELADDLRRFLDGRPVLARPTPAWERAWKWARRRPAAAGLIGVTVLAVGLLFGLGWTYIVSLGAANKELTRARDELRVSNANLQQTNTELESKKKSLQDSLTRVETEKTRADANAREAVANARARDAHAHDAEDNFLQAQAAINKLIQVSQKRLNRTPGAEKARRELLEQAQTLCLHFLDKKGDDQVVRLSAARAHRIVGEIHELLGDSKKAARNYRASLALYERLLADFKEAQWRGDYRLEMTEVHMRLWGVLKSEGSPAARQSLDEARKLLDRPLAGSGALYRRERAALFNDWGVEFQKHGEAGRAEEAYLAARKLYEGLPADRASPLELARAEVNLATLWTSIQGRRPGRAGELFDRARTNYERAIGRLMPLARGQDPDAVAGKELGRAYSNLGLLLTSNGRSAGETYRQAVELFGRLRDASPDVPDYRHLLAVSSVGLGAQLTADHRYDEAVECLGRARALLEGLAGEFKAVTAYREDLARACTGLGVARMAGRRPGAGEPLEAAGRLLGELADAYPGEASYRQEWEFACRNLIVYHDREARQLRDRQRWAEAEGHVRRLVKLRKELGQRRPEFGRGGLPPADLLPCSPAGWAGLAGGSVRLVGDTELAGTLLAHANLLLLLGDYAGAAAAVRELSPLVSPRWERFPRAVVVAARCTALADADRRSSVLRRQEMVREYGARTLRLLGRAASAGVDLTELLGSKDFDLFRTRPELRAAFRQVVADMRAGARASR